MTAIRPQGKDGKFVPKGDVSRTLRSMRLSEAAWEGLRQLANAEGVSRTDVVEYFALGGQGQPQQATIDTATIERVLTDPSVVRPKDRAAVRRGVMAVLRELGLIE